MDDYFIYSGQETLPEEVTLEMRPKGLRKKMKERVLGREESWWKCPNIKWRLAC